jgi:hypothetical protein
MTDETRSQVAERIRFGEKPLQPHKAAINPLRRWQAKASSGIAERTQPSDPPVEEKGFPQGSSGAPSTKEEVKPATRAARYNATRQALRPTAPIEKSKPMQLYFQNGYTATVHFAIAIYNTGCEPPWESQGWWGLDPGGSTYVADTCNRYFYFYAEATDGRFWAGRHFFEVAEGTFSFCPTSGIGFSGETVGMRQVDDQIGPTCPSCESFTVILVR